MKSGDAVQFFLEVDASDANAALVRTKNSPNTGLLMSHGWVPGKLAEDYEPSAFQENSEDTWAKVVPDQSLTWVKRDGRKAQVQNVHANGIRVRCVRPPANDKRRPLLSLAFIRWGGVTSKWMKTPEDRNDGDWGDYGSPPSDEYMKAMVKEGILAHPQLRPTGPGDAGFELFHLFVANSPDVWNVAEAAADVRKAMRGQKRSAFWMLWPAEWKDFEGDADYACYAERQSVFAAQRAFEGAGVASGFPHPADQFEWITSKTWMATMSVCPRAQLPACVMVAKEQVVANPAAAARDALAAVAHIRKVCPFPFADDDGDASKPRSLHEANKDELVKGVVKLGWSWENRFVLVFNSAEELKTRLMSMMNQEGCHASQCIVQEFVDFDFEMRQYFLPPSRLVPGDRLQPTKIECNAWGTRSGEHQVGESHASFSKVSDEDAIRRWDGDVEAWEAAKTKATDISQFLIAMLVASNAKPVPMIRLDFMMKRVGPGKVRAVFGEYCEMGACCLNWQKGPPTIWRAALDAALR